MAGAAQGRLPVARRGLLARPPPRRAPLRFKFHVRDAAAGRSHPVRLRPESRLAAITDFSSERPASQGPAGVHWPVRMWAPLRLRQFPLPSPPLPLLRLVAPRSSAGGAPARGRRAVLGSNPSGCEGKLRADPPMFLVIKHPVFCASSPRLLVCLAQFLRVFIVVGAAVPGAPGPDAPRPSTRAFHRLLAFPTQSTHSAA